MAGRLLLPSAIDIGNPVSDHPLNRGLVSWWLPLPQWSGGSRLFDLCRRNDGTLTNGPTWTAGVNGFGSVRCDGTDDFVVAPTQAPDPASNAFTLEIDLNLRSTSGTQGFICVRPATDPEMKALTISIRAGGAFRVEGYGSSSAPNLVSSVAPSVRRWHLLYSWNGSNSGALYVNGVSAVTGSTAPQTFTPARTFLGAFGSDFDRAAVNVHSGRIWNRAVSANDAFNLYEQSLLGYPDLLRRVRPWSFGVASSGAYTLTADAGSYAITGTAATLKAARTVTADAGSYTLTGNAATLKAARTLSAAAGAYTLTGNAANLLAARTLAADAGAYSYTGSAAGLLAARLLTSAAGSYALTGNAANLDYSGGGNKTLAADAGAYALTGGAATLTVTRVLAADAGSYALTGSAAGLARQFTLAAGAGAYTLTGVASSLLVARALAANSGTYTYTGFAATLDYSGVSDGPISATRVSASSLITATCRTERVITASTGVETP